MKHKYINLSLRNNLYLKTKFVPRVQNKNMPYEFCDVLMSASLLGSVALLRLQCFVFELGIPSRCLNWFKSSL